MEIASIITIIIAILIVYFGVKFIVSPILKAVFGVIAFLFLLYVISKLGFDLNKLLTPFGFSFNFEQLNIDRLFGPIDNILDKIKLFVFSIFKK
jgi:hypothetical protein